MDSIKKIENLQALVDQNWDETVRWGADVTKTLTTLTDRTEKLRAWVNDTNVRVDNLEKALKAAKKARGGKLRAVVLVGGGIYLGLELARASQPKRDHKVYNVTTKEA